ncbi:uncharacterized protein BHQ10_001284 [Talaromyces amestolkiae]|uniref:FAD-binding PCMH-type domain-containing protein n=1 Tax=Talaromyces amestolkiae TaxID=1196081 RepID=A0A364KNZ2_TALAM|nr:uncharacterized protein BHQ10_001284 [Talaromyces amestolkiae]RAO65272.1 hypothetical protein BHQ10_001284 [Talaromyces amestolkiae]
MTRLGSVILALPLLAAAQSYNLSALFQSVLSPGAEIYYANDSNWAQDVTQRWSTWNAPSYMGAIKPVTERDVQNIVKVASAHNISFLATGGGHGVSQGFANIQNAIDIDLSNFKTVDLDIEKNQVTVGGGATYGQLYDPLYNAGKEIPTGNAPCVGVIGATVGAGVGLLQGLHGYTSDALISARIVTASGVLFEASATNNTELFWAIRGAGANFGIITSATYRVYDATNAGQAQNADFLYPETANRSVWGSLQTLDETLPAELSVTISSTYNQTSGQAAINVNLVYFGSYDDFQPYVDQFLAINPTQWQNVTVPWNQLIGAANFGTPSRGCETNSHINFFSIALNQTDPLTFQGFFDDLILFSQQNPSYNGAWVIERYGTQGPLAIPEESRGVYPWREAKMQLLWESDYPDSSLDGTVRAFYTQQRQHFNEFSGFPTFAAYINYAHGDEGPNVWYGDADNLARLSAAKRKWDSNNLFGAAKPVPL